MCQMSMGILSSVLLFWAIWGGMDMADAGDSSESCDFYVPSDYTYHYCQPRMQPLNREECQNQAVKDNIIFRNSTYETIQNISYPARWYPYGCSYVETVLAIYDKVTKVRQGLPEKKTAYYQWFAKDYDDTNLAKTFQPTNLQDYVCDRIFLTESWRTDDQLFFYDSFRELRVVWTFSCMCIRPAEVTGGECCSAGFECGMDMEFRCNAFSDEGCSRCICRECDFTLFFRIASVNNDARLTQWRRDNAWRIADSQAMSTALDKIYSTSNCVQCDDVRGALINYVSTRQDQKYIVPECPTQDNIIWAPKILHIPILKKCYPDKAWSSVEAFNKDPDNDLYIGYQTCPAGQQVSCTATDIFCADCPPTFYKFGAGTARCQKCPKCDPGKWRICKSSIGNMGLCESCSEGSSKERLALLQCPKNTYKYCGYIYEATCLQCQDCPSGYYRSGCEDVHEGTCQPCQACPIGFERTSCGFFSAGQCLPIAIQVCEEEEVLVGHGVRNGQFYNGRCVGRDALQLTMAPECPYDDLANINAVDLLIANITQGFENVPCSTSCDGTGTADTQRCVGPYPCGLLTCMSGGHDLEGEPSACPVVEHYDAPMDIQATFVNCESCSQCGKNEPRNHSFTQWGAGCARECSLLLCQDSFIFDWTDGACKPCRNIWNNSICSRQFKDDNKLERKDISGNLLAIKLPNCQSSHENMHSIAYGDCEKCPHQTCGDNEYMNHICECVPCLRASAVSTSYLDASGETAVLNCQVRDCEENMINNEQDANTRRTGVENHGVLCETICTKRICSDGQYYEPCLLPHDSICLPHYPPSQNAKSRLTQVFDSANLLDTQGRPWHRWASFENLLARMDVNAEYVGYQCVWNVAGIEDNTMHPGGVSTMFWKVGETSATLYQERGTQVCRPWPLATQNSINYNFLPYPLLPLQNTVTFTGSENGRRILTNTTAYVVSYEFDGVTRGVDPSEIPPHTMPIKPDNFIDVGRQFLRLTLQGAPQADLMIYIPRDRQELLQCPGVRWWKFVVWMQDLTASEEQNSIHDNIYERMHVTIVQSSATYVQSQNVNAVEDFHVFPPLETHSISTSLTEHMRFGSWIDSTKQLCNSIHTKTAWGWWEVRPIDDNEIIVTSEMGDVYCISHSCSNIYHSMTAMPHREHRKLEDSAFVVDQELTVTTLGTSIDVNVMAIVSMADTPTGHHCLAYVATLTMVYCILFDPYDMTPDPLTLESKIRLHPIHSCHTSGQPNTVMQCMAPVAIAYDIRNTVLFVVDRNKMHAYSTVYETHTTRDSYCQPVSCSQYKCTESYYVNWDNQDWNVSWVVAMTVYDGTMFLSNVANELQGGKLETWRADVTCLHSLLAPTCEIKNFVLIQTVQNEQIQERPFNWKSMPTCSSLLEMPYFVLVCHDMQTYSVTFAMTEFQHNSLHVKNTFSRSTFIRYNMLENLIRKSSNPFFEYPDINDPEILEIYRRSAISIASLSDNRFVVGFYGNILEMSHDISVYKNIRLVEKVDSILWNHHFVQHSRAFISFYHSDGWPHVQEDELYSCRMGYESSDCVELYNQDMCSDSKYVSQWSIWTNLSIFEPSLIDDCYAACLENYRCIAMSASDTECVVWSTLYQGLNTMVYVRPCCVKSFSSSPNSLRFLTTNRINVKAMMYGNTKLLKTSAESGIGNHSWSSSDMLASCVPYYRINGELRRFTDVQDFQRVVPGIDNHGHNFVKYIFPDSLIVNNVEINYPFDLQLEDWHVQIDMKMNMSMRISVPCGSGILGLPTTDSNITNNWIEETSIFTDMNFCRSTESVVMLIMAYTELSFFRVYVSETEMVTYSSPVDIEQDTVYNLQFFLHETYNKLAIYDFNVNVVEFDDFYNMMHTLIDNIHQWTTGNEQHQLLATFNLSQTTFMHLQTPITRQAQTITIKTHRRNEDLTSVKYVAMDEVQVYPILTSPVGWRLAPNPLRYWSHLLTIPTESDMEALGIPVIEEAHFSFTVLRVEVYFIDKPVSHAPDESCVYRVGLNPTVHSEDLIPLRSNFVYPMTPLTPSQFTTIKHLPSGCLVSSFEQNVFGNFVGVCYIEVHFDLLNDDRQIVLYVDHDHEDDNCSAPVKLEATVPPRSTLHHCKSEFFWDENELKCMPCSNTTTCSPGSAPSRCANLLEWYEVAYDELCKPCKDSLPTYAEWTQMCEFQCYDGYFWDESVKACVACTLEGHGVTCQLNEYFEMCTRVADSKCQLCKVEDVYAEFIQLPIHIPCQTQCIDGYFLSDTGRCKPCTSLDELQIAINISNSIESDMVYYRHFNCTRYSNSFSQPCTESREYGQYVAHGSDFGMDCSLQCYENWQSSVPETFQYTLPLSQSNNMSITLTREKASCIQCRDLGNIPKNVYRYEASCNLVCLNGWEKYFYRAINAYKCVRCIADNCNFGQYRKTPTCAFCEDCMGKHELAFWTGYGTVNDPYSCPWQCNNGYFNEYRLGVCIPHSQVECNSSQYKILGTHLQDTECRECSNCEGFFMTSACTDTSDSVCTNCPGELRIGERFVGVECNTACESNYVRNSETSECELCNPNCPAGRFFPKFPDIPNNCSDCWSCPTPPVSSDWEWIEGCNWACKVGFSYFSYSNEAPACVAQTDNMLAITESSKNVRCRQGFKLNENFECIQCSLYVQTPVQTDLNLKWVWSTTGDPCTWTCIPPLIEYRPRGAQLFYCVEWKFYKTAVAIENGLTTSLSRSTSVLAFETVQPSTKIETWKIVAAIAGVIVLSLFIIFLK